MMCVCVCVCVCVRAHMYMRATDVQLKRGGDPGISYFAAQVSGPQSLSNSEPISCISTVSPSWNMFAPTVDECTCTCVC